MLPSSYGLAAAIVVVLGGAVACFAGHRLFRFVLAIYGFILGAMFASTLAPESSTTWMVVAAIVGGILGAAVLMLAYFVGIALVGAGLGAFIAHFGAQYFGPGDPAPVALIALSVLGAIGAMLLQRYVIILATSFGGAWTSIVGLFAIGGDRKAARAAAGGDVWILYPTNPAPGQRWVPIAWIVLGLIGATVQMGITARRRSRS
jgi:Domain of unknown function (DUF4203)